MYEVNTSSIIRDRTQATLVSAAAARQAREARRVRRARRRLGKPAAAAGTVALVGKPAREAVMANGAPRPAHVRGLRAFANWLSSAQL